MKNLFLIISILSVLYSCTPEDLVPDPETNIPPKIRSVKITNETETSVYSFNYNEDTTKLSSVLFNGALYATLNYDSNKVVLVFNLYGGGFTDSFIVKHTNEGYIDSIYTYNFPLAVGSRFDYYNAVKLPNARLFSAENTINSYFATDVKKNYSQTTFDTDSDNTLSFVLNYTGLGTIVSYDTLSYDETRPNQPNIPNQFISSEQIFGSNQSATKLNPIFLLQQSNIYPHRTHTHLINRVNYRQVTYGGFSTFTSYGSFNYNYTFDASSRVNQMTKSEGGIVLGTYQFEYFD
jgi:hypothetical protein